MPLLWRYLLSQYLKVFVLCVVAFIAILVTMRLDEIAYFATLGPEMRYVFLFALQQIPYILPIALPIAALISSILLVQGLSRAYELTAMRACGYSLKDILSPILVAAALFSALNFYIVSELSTTSHLQAGMLKSQLRSVNPLLLLHNKHVMRMKGFYFDTLGPSRIGEFAKDVVFFSPNKDGGRLNLLVAKQLQATPLLFKGDFVTIVTSQPAQETEGQDNLILENMQESETSIEDFSQMLEKKIWTINNDHLRLPLLLARLDEARAELSRTRQTNDKEAIKQAQRTYREGLTEVIRRISVALAVFTFTLMGLSFGISITRNHSNRGTWFVIALGTLYLFAFFVAKSFSYALAISAALYLLPHLIIIVITLWTLHRIACGVE